MVRIGDRGRETSARAVIGNGQNAPISACGFEDAVGASRLIKPWARLVSNEPGRRVGEKSAPAQRRRNTAVAGRARDRVGLDLRDRQHQEDQRGGRSLPRDPVPMRA
jgi:hypothetical protein